MFGFGKKSKNIEPVQVKSACTSTHLDYLMSSYGIGIFWYYIEPVTAYRFYDKIGPLQSTVSKITRAIGNLPLVLRNEDSLFKLFANFAVNKYSESSLLLE